MLILARLLRFILTHELARRHRGVALGRWLRWQIGGRIQRGPAIVSFIPPVRLMLRRGLSSASATHYVGLTDFAEMGFVLHALRPSDLMGDIGANVGVYSLLAAGVAGAEVVAVEPAPETLPYLEENLRLNRLPVRVLEVALGEAPGRLRLSARRGAANRLLRPDEAEAAVEVPITTLDLIFADRTPLLLKLDVEGYEARILAGGPHLLADPALRGLIVETGAHAAHYGDSLESLNALLHGHGFAPHDYDPRRRLLRPRAGPDEPNTLYLRDPEFWAARAKEGPAFRVFGETI